MISCSEAVRQLWEYLDGAVEESDRQAIEEHLSLCRRCCGELEFARELRRFLIANAREPIPRDVMARLQGILEEVDGR